MNRTDSLFKHFLKDIAEKQGHGSLQLAAISLIEERDNYNEVFGRIENLSQLRPTLFPPRNLDIIENCINNFPTDFIFGDSGVRCLMTEYFFKSSYKRDASILLSELIGSCTNEPDANTIEKFISFLFQKRTRSKVKLNYLWNKSDAARFCSNILTAVFPKTFIDFRQGAWDYFNNKFCHPEITSEHNNYGELLWEAGKRGVEISQMPTYKKYFNNTIKRKVLFGRNNWDNWIIAGLVRLISRNKPTIFYKRTYFDPLDKKEMFIEKRRLINDSKERNYFYRNPRLARLAKRLQNYNCMACGFNFSNKYGLIGDGYIECHHLYKYPKSKTIRESTVDDVNILCSNCHKMIHQEIPPLTLKQLRKLLKNNE